MNSQLLSAIQPSSITTAISLLKQGEIIAFPTDTVYGLGADAFNEEAILKLFEAKGREYNKAIAILVGSYKQLQLLTEHINAQAESLISEFWPGGLTVIVEKKAGLPISLSPTNTIGIRMPDHPVAIKLLEEFGPLATTSANLSGGKNPQNAAEVLGQLNERIPLILDGGPCQGGIPSTIVDCTASPVKILRQGAITSDRIFSILKTHNS